MRKVGRVACIPVVRVDVIFRGFESLTNTPRVVVDEVLWVWSQHKMFDPTIAGSFGQLMGYP